ncbi:MAG: DUF2993 domain-containing protein [Armatimonadetes bacterium]|nr:DUF2993 domain-containing protein [Armatimonadota bacterium]
MKRPTLPYLLLLVLGILLSGCTRPINRTAESRIRQALPEVLGPAKSYTVRVDSAWERTLQGKLARVSIEGGDVRFRNGLILDHLSLTLKGVEVDTDSHKLRKIRETDFTLTIGEKNLNEFIVDEVIDGESLRKIRLQLLENTVLIRGERVVLGVGIPFEISGSLLIKGPAIIELDTARLRVVGIPFTGRVLQFLKRRIENAVDLSQLSFPMVVNEVSVVQGRLMLTGKANPMPLIEQNRPNALW